MGAGRNGGPYGMYMYTLSQNPLILLKACPHSQKSATVAERLSPNSATVAVCLAVFCATVAENGDSRTFLRQCGQGFKVTIDNVGVPFLRHSV